MMSTLIEFLSHFVPFHFKSTRLYLFSTSFKHHLMHTVVTHLWLRYRGSKFNCEPALTDRSVVRSSWQCQIIVMGSLISPIHCHVAQDLQQSFGLVFCFLHHEFERCLKYFERWRIVLEVRKSIARTPYP